MDQRPLGLFEKFQASVKAIKCYGVVTFTAVLRHAVPRPPTEDARQFFLPRLHAAVSQIVAKHPLLSVALLDYDKPTIRYITIPGFDLDAIVSFGELVYWDPDQQAHRIAEQCDRDFDFDNTALPLWRIHIDTHPERPDEYSMTIAGEHTMADGMSLVIFMHELVELLATVEPTSNTAATPLSYMIPSNPVPLNMPCEERNGPKLTVDEVRTHQQSGGGGDDGCDVSPANAHCWQGDRRAAAVNKESVVHKTGIRLVKLDDPVWANVCAAAKQRGVSPHAAIMAALLHAFADIYPDEQAVETYTPMNTRAAHDPPVPHDEMGNFIGSYPCIWPVSLIKQHAFWDLAARYHGQVKEHKTDAAKEVHTFQFLGDYPDGFTDMWRRNWDTYRLGRSGGIEFSDLGRCAWAGDCVRELFFGQSAQAFSIAMGVNSVSTNHGMRATISFQQGTLDDAKLDAFAPTIAANLERCII